MKDEGKEKDLSEEYFFFAVNLAKEAGRLAISSRSKQGVAYEMKTSHKDLVTEVDRRVERFVVEEIRHRYPNHGIIGEEGTEIDEKEFSTYRWVIDPIDGTTNFIQQGINFCVSIALYEGNEGQVGVVYDPSRDELFAARRGSGVTLNGERVYPPHLEGMKEALIGTNLIWVGRTRKLQLEEAIYAIAWQSRGVRSIGAAALELAYVAVGRLNAYIGLHLSPWDYAAGKILVEEAGGQVSNFDGEPILLTAVKQGFLASHPSIHEELLQVLRRA